MARFYGGIHGSRGPATRLGTSESGIVAFAQGWDVGVKVVGTVRDGRDEFHVYANSGSNGGNAPKLIAVVTDDGVELRAND